MYVCMYTVKKINSNKFYKKYWKDRRIDPISTRSLIYSYTHILIYSYTHTLTHSYTHALIHSYTHTLIHSYSEKRKR